MASIKTLHDDRYNDRSRSTYATAATSSSSSSSAAQRHNFSLSDSDFQRDAVLQRHRYLSSERASTATPHSSSASTYRDGAASRTRDRSRDRDSRSHQQQRSRTAAAPAAAPAPSVQQPPHRTWSSSAGTRQTHHPPPPSGSATAAKAVAARAVATAAAAAAAARTDVSPAPQPVASRLRSKSKSRARVMAPPKPKSSDFIALGQRAHTTNSYKATYYGSDKYRSTVRSRSRSVGSTVATRTPAVATTASRSSTSAATAPLTSRPATTNGDAEERGRARERERERARERERELEREREALPAPRVALAKTSGSKSSRGAAAEAKARSKSSARSRKSRRSSRSSSSSSSSDDARRRAARKRSKSRARKASAKRSARSSSDSPSPVRSKSRRRSKSKSKDTRSRGKSKSRVRTTTASGSSSSSSIDAEIASTKAKLHAATSELEQLEGEMRALQQRVDAKKYQIKHLELDLEVVEKRKRIELEYSSGSAAAHGGSAAAPTSTGASSRDRHVRSVSRARTGSKRPCIVDTDESSDDDDVVIIDPVQVKEEKSQKRQRSSSKARSSASAAPRAKANAPVPAPVAMDTSLVEGQERATEIPDHFWGKADTPKLLAQHRVRTMPDGHVRKGRHLAFNPMKSDYFATSSDDGGLIMWSYERPTHEIAKMGSFSATSFRRENQCAESIVWSPDGNRLAMAFRDPIDGRGEFCVVLLHNLALTGSDRPQDIPSDRVTSMSTTLHSRGISAIEWIPSGYGAATTSRSLVTAGSDHAVILWEEHDNARKESSYKWKVLHREHRSEVKAICVHSQRQAIYTGGFDGQVIRYDMHKYASTSVLERRKPTISKINAVLEHPHNPHVLLVSCVEASEHSILLYDLREPYSSHRDSTMTLSWVKSSDSKSMSQYIVPRWSPAGMHVSCGSKSGLVNIWDVRVRGSSFPVVLPQQSIAVHQKSVLHATWHPRYNALFSVSNDRTLGLLTFRWSCANEHLTALMAQHRRSVEDAFAAERRARALEPNDPIDIAASGGEHPSGAASPRQSSRSERSLENFHALEKRVAELEERLAQQESRCCEHTTILRSTLDTPRDPNGSPSPREHEPLIEFFLTEMEKYQTMMTKLSLAHSKLHQELHEQEQAFQRFQSDQSLRMRKYLEIMRRMERGFVHGEQLRGEEKQLADAHSKKRVEAMKRTVDEQLATLRAQGSQHRSELEEKLEKKFVDVVVESQTLRAENMELRGDLQHVSALVRSNKKTIRILTEEILKIKRTAIVYPADVDELLVLQSAKARGDLSAFATDAAVHPSKLYHAS